MDAYLIDGTYELFRHHFALPSHTNNAGEEVSATRGVIGSLIGMLESGVEYIGVATDHVIESFRNEMWAGYKTSAGVDPDLLSQFPILEDAIEALGVALWPMVEHEADDALAGAAAAAAAWDGIGRVLICSPDKDLAQCVVEDRVVMYDRRKSLAIDAAGVVAKFGVPPALIPDYLALVGDSADGYPGLPGWGAKSAAIVLSHFGPIESIPADASLWPLPLSRATKLAETLAAQSEFAYLFRDLARLRPESISPPSPADLLWTGPRANLETVCARLESPRYLERARKLASALA